LNRQTDVLSGGASNAQVIYGALDLCKAGHCHDRFNRHPVSRISTFGGDDAGNGGCNEYYHFGTIVKLYTADSLPLPWAGLAWSA